MKKVHRVAELKMISVDEVEVLNPRDRNTKIFDEIVDNINNIGLKKPVTVTPRLNAAGNQTYLLICGEGRLKAIKALGGKTIAAMVVHVSDEDALIMSLAENIARRQVRTMELLAGIETMRKQGLSRRVIAERTGLSGEYVGGILQLLENGEERLLIAVESGRIPLNAALTISGAGNNEKDMQKALHDAYDSGELRGKHLLNARKIVEKRLTLGRSISRGTKRKLSDVTSSTLIRSYQREVGRQRLMVKKAELTQQRLLFVVEAMRQLLTNENFTNLLRAEKLETLPKYLADRIWNGLATA